MKQYQQSKSTSPSKIKTIKDLNILVIDDCEPDAAKGQGQGRSALLLNSLATLGMKIFLYPANQSKNSDKGSSTYTLVRPGPQESESSFLKRLFKEVSVVLVSRPTHMELVDMLLRSLPILENPPTIIYDAEALQSKREILKLEVLNETELSDSEIVEVVSQELCLATRAKRICTVSAQEAQVFRDFGFNNVDILGYGTRAQPTTTPFNQRVGLLSIGPLLSNDSPNSDATLWFLNNVSPWLSKLIEGDPIVLYAVGENHLESLEQRQGDDFHLLGHIQDLTPIYAHHRIFVAPTRYSAGIPIKVIEAAAHGVPIVASPLVASQLGWQDEQELLIGYSAQDFAAKCAALYRNEALWQRLRNNALSRVRDQFSINNFNSSLNQIISSSLLNN